MYCTVTDVQALEAGRQLIFADSPTATRPSLTQVNGFISQISSEIDQTIVRRGYQIPTATNAYLTKVNAMGAAALVEMSLCVTGSTENTGPYDMRKKEYDTMLQSIYDNPRLAGALPIGGSNQNYARSDGTSFYTNTKAPINIHDRSW